jgi:hypothetical protein
MASPRINQTSRTDMLQFLPRLSEYFTAYPGPAHSLRCSHETETRASLENFAITGNKTVGSTSRVE